MLGENKDNQSTFPNLRPPPLEAEDRCEPSRPLTGPAVLQRASAMPEWLRPRRQDSAAIVGTAACASCLAFLFGIAGLGIGSVAFVLKYQTFFLFGSIALIVLSLYFTAGKVNKHCVSC